MGRTVDRGYGAVHRRERDRWRPVVDRGEGICTATVCLETSRWIRPGTPWDLGHTVDRTGYIGPCHQACNRAEAGARGNARQPKAQKAKAAKRWRPSTNW